jgi:hypothetical protein
MVTIILAIALLVTLAGLVVEVGITSWNIHMTKRHRREKFIAEWERDTGTKRAVNQQQELSDRLEFLDDYASKISWLLDFLYKRYDRFADLETEINDGLKDVTGDSPVGETDDRYNALKKAMKIIRVTVKVPERWDSLKESVVSQADQVMEELQEDEDPESEESASVKEEESSNLESAE